MPGDAFLVEGRTLKLASGAVRVLEPTRCTMVFDDGVVQSAEGLPSKPVGFGEFYFNMKDRKESGRPRGAGLLPAGGGRVLSAERRGGRAGHGAAAAGDLQRESQGHGAVRGAFDAHGPLRQPQGGAQTAQRLDHEQSLREKKRQESI